MFILIIDHISNRSSSTFKNFFESMPQIEKKTGLDRFMDNGQFSCPFHGQFLIFIQTYGKRRVNQGVLGGGNIC